MLRENFYEILFIIIIEFTFVVNETGLCYFNSFTVKRTLESFYGTLI